MKEIILTNGKVTFVNDEDYDYFNQFSWRLKGNARAGYYVEREYQKDKKIYCVKLHQEVIKKMGLLVPKGMIIDHEDKNSLNNQRNNLRIVTYQENSTNTKIYSTNKTGNRGIHFDKKKMYYRVQITIKRTKINLGNYKNYDEALKVRKEAEIRYFGEEL